MVLLAKEDIQTEEVLDWTGIHLLHFSGSTCSKKIRMLLEYKGVAWTSHPINLVKRENNSVWFMGINPRGLVPVLVHDGAVHIESNDILEYLEELYPEPPLMSAENKEELEPLLRIEDDLHEDLRNLTMRYTAPAKLMQRSQEQLEQYQESGSGTVGGEQDSHKKHELEYWREFAKNRGITDAQVATSSTNFQRELNKLEKRLETANYLMGESVSILDISWFVNINRILLAGYPLKRLHPALWSWRNRMLDIPAFANEASASFLQTLFAKFIWLGDTLKGRTLSKVAGF